MAIDRRRPVWSIAGRRRPPVGVVPIGQHAVDRAEEADHRARCEQLVDQLELGVHRGRPVGLLPYGVQKLVDLGRALAMEPHLLLLDEPAAGAGAEEIDRIRHVVLDARDRLRMAVLVVEHDMDLVASISDRIVVLDAGHVIADGLPGIVLADPEVARVYLGRRSQPDAHVTEAPSVPLSHPAAAS